MREANHIHYLLPWDYNKAVLLDFVDEAVKAIGGKPVYTEYSECGLIEKRDHEGIISTNHFGHFGLSAYWQIGSDYITVHLDDNPFFPMHICKTKGKPSTRHYFDELDRSFMLDGLFSVDCDIDTYRAAAHQLLAIIMQTKYSKVVA